MEYLEAGADILVTSSYQVTFRIFCLSFSFQMLCAFENVSILFEIVMKDELHPILHVIIEDSDSL